MGRSGLQVYVVDARAGTYYNLQLPGSIEHFGVYDVAANDDGVGIGHRFQQFSLLAILFQQDQFVTGCFCFFTDTVDSHFGERFVCCYYYFHKDNVNVLNG